MHEGTIHLTYEAMHVAVRRMRANNDYTGANALLRKAEQLMDDHKEECTFK